MARADKSTGKGKTIGHPSTGPSDPDAFDESDIAAEIKGRNKLQGDDQGRVQNQRQDMPEEKPR